MLRVLLLCLLWPIGNLLFAQEISINITIKDATNGNPLPYATLYLQESAVGTTTKDNGQAALVLSPQYSVDTLVCSYVGYETLRLVVGRAIRDYLIELTPQAVVLGEVQVTDKKALKVKQILKQVFKNTAKNYGESFTQLTGNYRESILQDGKYIQYNEAAVAFNYSAYPQKFDKRIWQSWYNDKEYAFSYERTFFWPILHYFNTKADQVRIIESRSSDHLDAYHEEHALTGGPLDLAAMDLVKYQCDFLNPRLINKYNYEKKGVEFLNGHNCYVLQFHPKPSNRSFRVDMGKKIKHSLYSGRLYIDVNTFAVVRAAYQLIPEVDFGFFAKRKPLEYKVALDYKKQGERWHLDKIKYSEVKGLPIKNDAYSKLYGPVLTDARNQKVTLYCAQRSLQILKSEVQSPIPFPPSEQLKHTRYSTLRYFEKPYHAQFWEKYLRENKLEIPPNIVQDLSAKRPLSLQFEERFQQKENLPIPIPEKEIYTFNYPSEKLTDNYQWFADSTKVDSFFNYLKAENTYAKNYLIPTRNQQRKFFDSVNDFYQQDTSRVLAYKAGDLRWQRDSLNELLIYEYLDSVQRNVIFNSSAFQRQRPNSLILKFKRSNDHLAVHYTTDASRNTHLLLFPKGSVLPIDSIFSVPSFEFFKNDELLYTVNNSQYRSYQIHHKRKGEPSRLLYEEKDPTFDIDLSRQGPYIFCTSLSKNESEIYGIDKNKAKPTLQLLQPRQPDVLCSAKADSNFIYLLSNEAAVNNKILQHKITEQPLQQWATLVNTQKDFYLADFWITNDYLILKGYEKSLPIIKYKKRGSEAWQNINFPHDIFDAEVKVLNTDSLFISYSSPLQLYTQYIFNLPQGTLQLGKQSQPKDSFNIKFLQMERLWARAVDGQKIPITLVKSKNPLKVHQGLILRVYGAYGAITAQGFDPVDALLAREGFTIAYAHVRGGSLLGGDWYKQGKLLTKENTFSDYLACAEYLINKKYTDADHLIGHGISAGGLPLAVAINRRPELFAAAILDHAFVDVLTTMMNPALPLTQDEYKEWGNPQDPAYYKYIKNYCPYQNVKTQNYPALLFLAGALDYQTPTWQIAKYAAKIKSMQTGEQPILLMTDFAGGHRGDGSAAGWVKEAARAYGFLIGEIRE